MMAKKLRSTNSGADEVSERNTEREGCVRSGVEFQRTAENGAERRADARSSAEDEIAKGEIFGGIEEGARATKYSGELRAKL